MALTYGFFNSVSGDRVYNADQISSMFEGLISDGVYESVGDAYIVTASTGLNILVGTGRALLKSRWAKNDAPITLTLATAHALLPRYTAVVLRCDLEDRQVTVEMIDGTPASNPSKPSILRTSRYFDLLLAYVYVGAAATSVTQANIEDMRANTTYCGWVTGIITQVDTSQLFLQWQTAYETFYAQATAAFEAWFEDLTEELRVDTYIEQYTKSASVVSVATQDILLDMTGYTYSASDIFIVSFNGLSATRGTDWTLDTTGATPKIHVNMSGSSSNPQSVDITVLKSKIGSNVG